jgi:hypothetical protein
MLMQTIRPKENMYRTQNLSNFIDHYLQSRAVAGEQKLQAMDSYYKTVNKNRMFNNMVQLMDPKHYTLGYDENNQLGFNFDDTWKVSNPVMGSTVPSATTTKPIRNSLRQDKDGNYWGINPNTGGLVPINLQGSTRNGNNKGFFGRVFGH